MAACALQSGSEATPSTPRSDATRLAAARANHATATETAATELAERMPSLPWEAPLPFGYAPSATRSSPSGTRSSFGFTQTLPPRAASGLLPVTPKAAAAVEPVRRPNPLGEAVGADGSGDGGGGDGDGDSDSDDGGSDSGDDTGQGEGAKLVGSGTGDLFGPRGFCCGGGGGGGGGAATSTDRAGGGGGARPGLGLGMGLRLGGASLKLDLRSLSVPEVVGDRPDEVGRAPPTPTAAIVERLRAEATALAGHQAGHQAAMSPAAAMPPAAAMAGPSLTRALSEMSVADISSALAATNRSLLSGMGASWAVDASEIRFRERLGAGAYGEVFAAEWRRSRVAVKRLLCTVDDRSVQQFYTEMEILANARHDNIVRFLGGCVQPDSLCILLEFCPRSLYDLLRQSQEALPLSQVLRTARQVAGGLYYLHCCTPPVRRLDLRPTSPYPFVPVRCPVALPSPCPLTLPLASHPPPTPLSGAAPRPQVGQRPPRRARHRKGVRLRPGASQARCECAHRTHGCSQLDGAGGAQGGSARRDGGHLLLRHAPLRAHVSRAAVRHRHARAGGHGGHHKPVAPSHAPQRQRVARGSPGADGAVLAARALQPPELQRHPRYGRAHR